MHPDHPGDTVHELQAFLKTQVALLAKEKGAEQKLLRAHAHVGIQLMFEGFDQLALAPLVHLAKTEPDLDQRVMAMDILASLGPQANWVAEDFEAAIKPGHPLFEKWFAAQEVQALWAAYEVYLHTSGKPKEGCWEKMASSIKVWLERRRLVAERNPDGLAVWTLDAGRFAALINDSKRMSWTLYDLFSIADIEVEAFIEDQLFRKKHLALMDSYNILMGQLRSTLWHAELDIQETISLSQAFTIFLNETAPGALAESERLRLRRLLSPFQFTRKHRLDEELTSVLLETCERLVGDVRLLAKQELFSATNREALIEAQRLLVDFATAVSAFPSSHAEQFLEITEGLESTAFFNDKLDPTIYSRSLYEDLAEARLKWRKRASR